MASTGNQNQQAGGGPFDVRRFFSPSSSPPPITSNPNTNFQNPNTPYPPPSATASYPPPTVTGGPYSYPHQTPIYHPMPVSNLHHQRSGPYPTPPAQPTNSNPNPNPNHGARLIALLSSPPAPPVDNPVQPSVQPMLPSSHPGSGPLRIPSRKLPKGRHLSGDRVVYDIDEKLPGEVQPQLEVTPITKYGSDPVLVMGRQIAVNKTYICYGLKTGAIRVLNINTALRSLFRGLSKRVTDMVFFAEDVHLLATASIDGQVYIWKITEGKDEDDKPQITGKLVIAVQIVGEEESVHPRVCWHCHKQEVLVVGIGKRVLRIDATKVGRGETYSVEEPLKCPVDKLVNGIQFVGSHEGEVTDLSMCQWMTTRLVSASVDGTIKIWEDRKSTPLAVLRPHDGFPVNSVTFVTAPHRPDHIILITGGPLNREVKVWASNSEEGWLLPSDNDESWQCLQTLELKSSSSESSEDAFFNQVVALPQTGLVLLANAKKNAIYVVHLEYGPNPESTRMDYISEFTVTMPILSFIGTSSSSDISPHGGDQQIVQVYCVQTLAIQQYALDISQCLPPPIVDDKDLTVSHEEGLNVPEPSRSDTRTFLDVLVSSTTDDAGSVSSQLPEASVGSPPVASSQTTLTRELSGLKTPTANYESGDVKSVEEYSVDKQQVNASDFVTTDETTKFKHPTHLVTPSELMATSSEMNNISEQKNDVDSCFDVQNAELEVKVVGETGKTETVEELVSQGEVHGFASQASDFGRVVSVESYIVNESRQFDGSGQTLGGQDESQDSNIDVTEPVETPVPATLESSGHVSSAKGKKHKGKNAHGSNPSSVFNSTDSSVDPGVSSNVPSIDLVVSQLNSMQETITQVLMNQKEIQKQIPGLVSVPVTKEGRKIEVAIGKTMEKTYKSNSDALWARTQEEFTKFEKSNRDRSQQLSGLIVNAYKDLPAAWEKMLKKETSALVPAVMRSVTPVIEKTVSTAITEAFQRGVADKSVNQLEKSVNSKLEASIVRQIQTQFQTTGKQALQEAFKSSMEASVIPAFEKSCKTMFDQVDATFQKGMMEHTSTAQQQIESANSPLAIALRDALNSASSLTRTLSGDLADGQIQLVALALSRANPETVNPLIKQLSNGPIGSFHEKIEAPLDPTKELSRLVYEHKYEEAFTTALQRSDVWIVSWLCSQVDLQGLLTSNPLPLSQGVLLSLLQQLACDIGNDTSKKLMWMMDVVVAIKPSDAMIAMHVRPIFDQVYSILNHQMSVPTTSVSELSSIRVVMKLINSTLRTL